MPSPELLATYKTLEAAYNRKRYRRFEFFEPYAKQMEFCNLGATKRERALMAGTQQGKSETGSFEAACHMTGIYPAWWKGRRWDRPTRGWVAGETSEVTRSVQQKKLCGEPGVTEAFGTGMIPRDLFADTPSLARGVTDAYDTIQVRHVSGGVSIARFKSYEQGRTRFQGETIDWAWTDEEAPMDVYSEILGRITATKGMVYCTFTPLKGKTDLVMKFTDEPSPDRAIVTMTMLDAKHILPEERASIIAGFPPHEREARVNGIPMMGSGRIFPYPEDLIREPALEWIPPHWVKIWGTDFGIGHPFAAVLLVWDRDTDTVHIVHTVRIQSEPGQAGGLPMNHAAAMLPIGAAVPVAWPQDGAQRDKGSGVTLAATYRKQKLLMLGSHATWPDGGVSTEAGILEMQQRMETGKLRVASHLSDWWEEYRNYHRKDGLIVKMRDDLMSATRIALMMKRHARAVLLGGKVSHRREDAAMAEGRDFDLFTGR